jgi:transmembrane sensor
MSNRSHTEIDFALLGKYLSGEALPGEAIQVEEWISASAANKQQFEQISNVWSKLATEETHHLPDKEEALRAIKNRLTEIPDTKTVPLKKTKFWLSIAASLLVVTGAAFLFGILLTNRQKNNISYITRQAQQQVLYDTLPDGSVVILNSHSLIKYDNRFNELQRQIQLQGEAWFNVTPNAARPFIITTGPVQVKVIGTSFNVRNNNNKIEIVVKTGVVRMLDNKDSITLQAGQKGIYNTGEQRFSLITAFHANEIGYATKVFNFENATLKEIATQLEKAYGISIILKNEKLAACTISSSFDNKPIEYILDVLAITLNIQYHIENKTVYISGNSCT